MIYKCDNCQEKHPEACPCILDAGETPTPEPPENCPFGGRSDATWKEVHEDGEPDH